MSRAPDWEARFRRERRARQEAESLLEQKAQKLFQLNSELERSKQSLESVVARRTAELEYSNRELREEIVRRTRTEQELIEARDHALRLSRQKESFLARVSHEIRTPLNSVIGYTRLLRETPLADDARAKLEAIESSGGMLLEIINDLLDLSQIDAGKMRLEHGPCDVEALVEETLRMVKPEADDKHLELIVQKPLSTSTSLWLDAGRLRQILSNLVSNAVKYTQAGTVTVSFRLHAEAPEGPLPETFEGSQETGQLELSVTDTGVGIPADRISTLFDPFERIAQGGDTVGTGLGLAITQRLTELMGGELLVDSAEGKGSTFSVRLPCVTEPAAGASAPELEPGADSAEGHAWYRDMARVKPLRILAADDNEVNLSVLEGLLELLGYRVDVVKDGFDAVHAVQAGSYDVVLMDVRMPHLNGMEATRHIREHPDSGSPYIAAITASAIQGDRERFLACGMDDYLSKPVDLAALARVLDKAYARKASLTGSPAGAAAEAPPLPSALVIDLTELRERLGDALDPLLARVVPVFLRELPGRLAALRQAVEADDAEAVASVTHALKGSSVSVGAVLLGEVTCTLQQRADHGEMPVAQEVTDLEALAQQTASALRAEFPTAP